MKKIFLSMVLAAGSWAVFAQDTTSRTTNQTTTNDTTQMSNMNSTNNMNSNTTTNQANTMNTQAYNSTSTSNYSAYGIPTYVQQNFQTNNPSASNVMWDRPTADWYHGYYLNSNGRYTNVYYSTDPYYNSSYYPERVVGYTVSLPVLQTYVPDAVITNALNQYKQQVYDITGMKSNHHDTAMYLVRILDNGELKNVYMDESGAAVADYLRVDEPQMSTTNTNTINSTDTNAAMNSNVNTNTDINTTGNTKTKVKTVTSNGKTITKTKNGKTRTKTSSNNMNNDQQ